MREIREAIARIIDPEAFEPWEGWPIGQREALAKADAILSRVVPDWQPIESAPKDGTEFMGWAWQALPEDGGYVVSDVRWDERLGWFSPGDGMVAPTHWLPLPEPPRAMIAAATDPSHPRQTPAPPGE